MHDQVTVLSGNCSLSLYICIAREVARGIATDFAEPVKCSLHLDNNLLSEYSILPYTL
jgi:hypothetical protein